jgi:cellulose synthase/poly-beta-1,6-N-acetylglucosamine synthase-like glycosyltransferase
MAAPCQEKLDTGRFVCPIAGLPRETIFKTVLLIDAVAYRTQDASRPRRRTELDSVTSSRAERVTALVMTYNHERFIGQALDSVLMQETNFDYGILISEDCSTDRTREIIQEYATRHPERIRLILSDHNLRTNEIVTRGIREAQGEYVALLDGDDYWLARHKLQNQVDFLDTHPECSVCFHQQLR